MRRRVPIVPTLLVIAAAATMVWLGFWQLARLRWKEDLLARYANARVMRADVPWPRTPAEAEGNLYRHARIDCVAVVGASGMAGRSATDTPGIAHVATCRMPDGAEAKVVLGWSSDPAGSDWRGGIVSGTIAPGPRLVADPPLAGLAANARPDPSEIPNNHLAYAAQWFLFAATALVIYALALRKRWATKPLP